MKFRFRRYYLYYLGRVLFFIIYLLPLEFVLYLADILGAIAFVVLAKYRRIAIANLAFAFGPEKTIDEIRNIAKAAFQNLAKNGVELINFPKINKANLDRFVKIRNIDIIDNALKEGKGAIVLTGHIGNWELLGLALRLKGYHGAAIGRRIYFDKYDKYLNRLRRVHDVNVIYRDESPKKVLKVLKSNGIIGILADQDMDSIDGIFVNFFGHPAYTPVGPVALTKASGARLIPAFIIRENGGHALMFEKPIELADSGDKGKDLIANTQKWSDVVESSVRRYPEQWVWMHRRWKTKPD
ncbi:MAG: hypothetical protein A2987_02100 [Omnitrophica bacterium RIFCSPLOWO2_01_FULL_45_10]|nr:MAG: hypothetical protein A2987_02100 [Omnitrophica bacterium RIFCSPLOWO2_01_FULL_45_10]